MLSRVLDKLGVTVTKTNYPSEFEEIYKVCSPYTLLPKGRMYSLYQLCKYILERGIPGDFVECGVWKGGASMLMAAMLKKYKSDRLLWMYDTYEGMPPASEFDKRMDGSTIQENSFGASVSEVVDNMDKIEYPRILVMGMVEDTIPGIVPRQIALLRLDTDYYSSTLHELNYLYPRLSNSGFLIIDDYGAWQGARKAVEEYFDPQPYWIHADKHCVFSIKTDYD